ncbi:hypothetical protein LPA44_14145 [Halobacterium sp. KA-4]|uniref:hypothetical protein n=1 Tax=Halobacterium sp. KA-4 TaxID=2896367 RepID=UPI001E3943AD|nr:hypothetical protein [Halobacterium sp. KA-4]MCD2201025.1 hypothetical protein [Halobacterium sp. KA-4]
MYTATRQPDDLVEATIHTGAQSQELLLAAGDRTLKANYPLIRAAQEELPRQIGFEIVEATKLGATPALTACLLGPNTPDADITYSQPSRNSDRSHPRTALRQYLSTLINNGLAHVIRILVRNAGSDREVSVRAAIYDPNRQWVSDSDHATALNDGTIDPATYFTDDAITSSWRLPLTGTWNTAADAPVIGDDRETPRLYLDTDKIRALERDEDHQPDIRRRLARSPAAFDALRERTPSQSQLREYDVLDVDPWLPVDAETLPVFLTHAPAYYDRDQWPPRAGWEPFTYSVESILREAPGTVPGTTNDRIASSVDPIETLDVDADNEHTQAAITWLQTRGTLQDPRWYPSATFELVREKGVQPVLVVTDETLGAGDLIALVSAAAREKTTAYIVADTDETADRVAALLAHPFHDTTPKKVRLYTTSQPLKANGAAVVYPRSAAAPTWWLTPDGSLELWGGNEQLAHWTQPWTPEALVASLPTCHRVNDELVICGANGDHSTQFQTADALAASWAPLQTPIAPAFLATGLYYGTILTPTARGFQEYHHRPAWVTNDDPRYRSPSFTREVIERFLDQYTVATDADPLEIDQVFPRLCTWLRTIDPYGLEFDLDRDRIAYMIDDLRQWRYPPYEPP